MKKEFLIREYFQLEDCKDGVCRDLLTEEEKYRANSEGAMFLIGKLQEAEVKDATSQMDWNHYLYRKTANEILKNE